MEKLDIVGVYVANKHVYDKQLHPSLLKLANQIDKKLGGGAIILKLTCESEGKIGWTPYHCQQVAWKEAKIPLRETSGASSTAAQLVKQKAYCELYDFDNHLVHPELDWLVNTRINQLC